MKNFKKLSFIAVILMLSSCGETCYECKMSVMGMQAANNTLCEEDFKSKKQMERAVKDFEKNGGKCEKL